MKNVEAAYHTRGVSEYVDDVRPPTGMLHAAVFASPVAHASITTVDVSAARAVPGVTSVILAADIPGENQIGPIIHDQPLLAEETVEYIGQPVAVVIAESPGIARQATRLIKVDYKKLRVVTDPREAFALGNTIGPLRTFEMGSVDDSWAACDVVVEGRADVGGQEHVYLETQRARAIPLEGSRLRVFASTQGPYAAQKAIARLLGLQHHDVEVDVTRIGGGFGGKEDQATPWSCIAALGAWHTGRPVELVLRRDEDMIMTGKRHPYSADFKIGASKDGNILAFEIRHYQNAGAHADLSPPVLERTLFHGTNAYFIPNVRIFAASCKTNLPPFTAFRGFGGPQGMFAIESAIAQLADATGLSREHIQRANLLEDGDVFPYGQHVRNGLATRTWDQAVSKYDLAAIQNDIADFNQSHFETKRGVAVMPICFGISFTKTFMNQAGALVHVYSDGSVGISTGGIEMGQGLSTNITEIASRAFGIGPDRIRIESTNTTRVANTSPSAASATTMLNGNATLVAIREIQARMANVARKELGVHASAQIAVENERVLCEGSETSLTWSDLVLRTHLSRVDLSSHGFFAPPGLHFDRETEKGNPFAYHVYGTAIIEITLDCLRGRYTVDAVKIVHDVGRPLNRLVDLGQIEGGLAQGLGWMTMEDLQFDGDGRCLSSALATYKVPDTYFMPDDIQVTFLEDADEETGPFGSKGVGEPPLMYGIGVFFALRSAMRAFRPDLQLPLVAPLTPERVLMTLHPEIVNELLPTDQVKSASPAQVSQ